MPLSVWAIQNFKSLYFFLLAWIPLSIEFDVTDNLATDLPTEPLMAGFLLIALFYGLRHVRRIDFSFFFNPVMFFLALHLVWLMVATIFSTVPLFSIKFMLAKWWYVTAFLGVTALVIKNVEDVKRMFWAIFIPLTFA